MTATLRGTLPHTGIVPGTLEVSWTVGGSGRTATDNGEHRITGDASGTINYATGAYELTPASTPPAGTVVTFAYDHGTGLAHTATPTPDSAGVVSITLPHTDIQENSIEVEFPLEITDAAVVETISEARSETYTGTLIQASLTATITDEPPAPWTLRVDLGSGNLLTDNGAGRLLRNGVDIGAINYDTGSASYSAGAPTVTGTFTVTYRRLTVPLEWVDSAARPSLPAARLTDNGAGAFWSGGVPVGGTINYAAGTLSFVPRKLTAILTPSASFVVKADGQTSQEFTGWGYVETFAARPSGAAITVRYRSGTSVTAGSHTHTVNTVDVPLAPPPDPAVQDPPPASGTPAETPAQQTPPALAGTVRFSLNGKQYADDGQGNILADIDAATGTGTTVGTVNYTTRRVALSVWLPGTGGLVVAATAFRYTAESAPVDRIVFRVPGAPLRPGSFQLRATPLGGWLNGVPVAATQWDVTADEDGSFALSGKCIGEIDYQTGIVKARFGAWVTASGNENKPWYDADAVVGGQIFKPNPVRADSIRYNAVALTYLPMSADRLGVDPVRLPQDGRVPIFRTGDVIVIHHTAETAAANPVVAGSTLNLGRARLSRVRVEDADGDIVPAGSTTYSVDLDTGIVTWAGAGSLNLSSYTQPLTVIHRIEDEALATDVDLSGRIALNKPLSHVFPDGSLASSALEMGNIQSRAFNLFTQATWTGEWSDSRIGDEPSLQFNSQNYTIAVTNEAAITERWALVFTSATQYRVIGENLGQIAQGIAISQSFAPSNPITGLPYFTIPANAFGLGGSTGNVFRFNTEAAASPVWVAVTVLPGVTGVVEQDSLEIYIRGNAA